METSDNRLQVALRAAHGAITLEPGKFPRVYGKRGVHMLCTTPRMAREALHEARVRYALMYLGLKRAFTEGELVQATRMVRSWQECTQFLVTLHAQRARTATTR